MNKDDAVSEAKSNSQAAQSRCLHQIFAERAGQFADRVALTYPGRALTYRELNARSDAVAHELIGRGVRVGSMVALSVERTPELVIGLIGILKAGAAYVPIDPSYPARRIERILQDSAVDLLVTDSRVSNSGIGAVRRVLLDQLDVDGPAASVAMSDDSGAYVIYTSGSTGTPKGVVVEHRNVVRLFSQTQQWFDFGPDDVWTLFHSAGFDFSVWEIWGALLHGGRLVIVPFDVTRSPSAFHAALRDEKVTVLNQTPSAFRNLIAVDAESGRRNAHLRTVILGGERLDMTSLRPWFARHGDARPAVFNMYGITETTVHVTCKRLSATDAAETTFSPIGREIPDLRIHLLDEQGRPVAPGSVGEIFVEGAGLARGYLNNPDENEKRFVRKQIAGKEVRLYRSGDLAIQGASGELFYAGRADEQLKVRGFRIEPGEIEACMAREPRVAGSVITAHDFGAGDVRLVAYVMLDPAARERASADVEAALRLIAAELPMHMRPSAYVFLDALPVTEHGKIDRARLPVPVMPVHARGSLDRGDAVTSAVIPIWEKIVGNAAESEEDDFFDLGGTSIALLRLLAEIHAQLGVRLETHTLVEGVTLGAINQLVRAELHNSGTRRIVSDSR